MIAGGFFLEQLIWGNFLAGEESFTQRGTKINNFVHLRMDLLEYLKVGQSIG